MYYLIYIRITVVIRRLFSVYNTLNHFQIPEFVEQLMNVSVHQSTNLVKDGKICNFEIFKCLRCRSYMNTDLYANCMSMHFPLKRNYFFCYIYYNFFPEINIKKMGVIVQTCVLIFLNDIFSVNFTCFISNNLHSQVTHLSCAKCAFKTFLFQTILCKINETLHAPAPFSMLVSDCQHRFRPSFSIWMGERGISQRLQISHTANFQKQNGQPTTSRNIVIKLTNVGTIELLFSQCIDRQSVELLLSNSLLQFMFHLPARMFQ